jgi:hypothetical protein
VSRRDTPAGDASEWDGARTAPQGTPVAVDVSRDRLTRVTWVAFLGGPVTWITHFMVVYLIAEAGCTGDGPGLDAFDPPVPTTATLAATAAAALACLGFARWGYRRWQESRQGAAADDARELSGRFDDRDRGGSLAFAGFALSLFAFVAVLFVGLPALVLEC